MKHRKWQGMATLAVGFASLAAWAHPPADAPSRAPEAEAVATAAPVAPTTTTLTIPAADGMGTATRLWLTLQQDGRLAAGKPQVLSGPVMGKIHERYLNSFTHPIPERFVSEKIGSNSASR